VEEFEVLAGDGDCDGGGFYSHEPGEMIRLPVDDFIHPLRRNIFLQE
jgi:hypothetical protein